MQYVDRLRLQFRINRDMYSYTMRRKCLYWCKRALIAWVQTSARLVQYQYVLEHHLTVTGWKDGVQLIHEYQSHDTLHGRES